MVKHRIKTWAKKTNNSFVDTGKNLANSIRDGILNIDHKFNGDYLQFN